MSKVVFSTYRVVQEDQIFICQKTYLPREAAATEPLAVAIHAVQRSGDISGRKCWSTGAGRLAL